jgi:hypothetical protein
MRLHVLKVAAVLVVALPRPGLRRSVLKMAALLEGAVPSPGSYNCVLKSQLCWWKVPKGLIAVF